MLELLAPLGIIGLLLASASGLAKAADRKLARRPYRCRRLRTKGRIERRRAAALPAAPRPAEEAELPSLPFAASYRNRALAIRAERELREEIERERRAEAREAELRELKARRIDGAAVLRAQHAIEHAVNEGLFEVEIARFPVELTTDNARAINNAEAGWRETLRGLPADLRAYFARRPGYAFRAYVCQFRPNGTPEAVALVLRWA